MYRKNNKFSEPTRNDISWIEVILLFFLTCIAIFLLYSSLNRHAEDIVVQDSEIMNVDAGVQVNE